MGARSDEGASDNSNPAEEDEKDETVRDVMTAGDGDTVDNTLSGTEDDDESDDSEGGSTVGAATRVLDTGNCTVVNRVVVS